MEKKIKIKALRIEPKKNISFISDYTSPSSKDDLNLKWFTSSVCNSERRRFNLTKSAKNIKPFIGGHEAVGFLNNGSYLNKKYALLPHSNCLTRGEEDKCLACENGKENLCSKMMHAGLDHGTPSGFTDYMYVSKNQLIDVTDLDDNVSLFLEPLACVIRSWDLLNFNDRANNVGIVGGGPIGCLHAMYISHLNSENKITIIENSTARRNTLKEIFKDFENIDISNQIIKEKFNITVMACSDSSGYSTAYEILQEKGHLILFSGFNNVKFKKEDYFPEIIHRNEFKHYTGKKVLIGSSGYTLNEIMKSKRLLINFHSCEKIITGKVYGIDSKILYKKDGSKQIFEEPVIIKDLKGEFKEQIKIQYFNNSSVDENTIFKYQNNF